MSRSDSPAATWWPSDASRGALALVTGRGERAAIYDRFGRRLSADGYVVAVFESDSHAASRWLETFASGPRVLVGSDAGSSAILHLLTHGTDVDGAIIVGTLIDSEASMPSDAERTSCPSHRRVLASEAGQAPLPHRIDAVPDRADLAAIDVPVLALHGGADPIAPLDDVVALLDAIPDLDFRESVGGLHDVVNDSAHRSVAAAIVLWLERLREGDARAPLVRRHPLSRFAARPSR